MAPFQTIQETTNKEDDSRFNGYHVIVGRMPGEEKDLESSSSKRLEA